ncbi:hypothetical protein BGZ83_001249 [Gryganskiella cystojenkinii]|nr:hypothetical protein BGZ83_001249 [Gryganskiella cystojenkinii]
MIASYLQKKNKEKKAAALLPTYDNRLSSESVIVPHDDSTQPLQDGIHRRQSVMDVNDKKLQRKQWIMLGISMFFDIILPVVLYYTLKSHISALAALLISSAPPTINCIFKFVIYRRVDPIGLLIVFGFILSAVLSVIDGNPRLLLLRDSFVTCASGLIFLVSLIPIEIGRFHFRPLTYGVSAQMMAAAPKIQYLIEGKLIEQTRSEFCWQWSHQYRRGMRITTGIWGVALLLEFTLRLFFYFSGMTLDQLVMWGNIVLACTLGTAGVATMVLSHYIKKWTTSEVAVVKAQLERDHEEWEAAHNRAQQQQQQQQQQHKYPPQQQYEQPQQQTPTTAAAAAQEQHQQFPQQEQYGR